MFKTHLSVNRSQLFPSQEQGTCFSLFPSSSQHAIIHKDEVGCLQASYLGIFLRHLFDMAINTANIKANMMFQPSMVPWEDPKSLTQGRQDKTLSGMKNLGLQNASSPPRIVQRGQQRPLSSLQAVPLHAQGAVSEVTPTLAMRCRQQHKSICATVDIGIAPSGTGLHFFARQGPRADQPGGRYLLLRQKLSS